METGRNSLYKKEPRESTPLTEWYSRGILVMSVISSLTLPLPLAMVSVNK